MHSDTNDDSTYVYKSISINLFFLPIFVPIIIEKAAR